MRTARVAASLLLLLRVLLLMRTAQRAERVAALPLLLLRASLLMRTAQRAPVGRREQVAQQRCGSCCVWPQGRRRRAPEGTLRVQGRVVWRGACSR